MKVIGHEVRGAQSVIMTSSTKEENVVSNCSSMEDEWSIREIQCRIADEAETIKVLKLKLRDKQLVNQRLDQVIYRLKEELKEE